MEQAALEQAALEQAAEAPPPAAEAHSPGTLGRGWTDARNLRHTSTPVGGVGLLRVAGADLGPRGLLRFAVTGEYFSSASFPVQGAQHTHGGGTFSVAYVPLELLEVYAAYGAVANTNSRSSPRLIQALGDVTLGARGARQWRPGLWAGVDARLLALSGVGSQDVGGAALGFAPRLVATYDVGQLRPGLPLRAHANVGLQLDGTGGRVDTSRLNAAEEYSLGLHRYHRFALGLGLEAPLPVATAFVEYNLGYPLGVEGGMLVSPDGTTLPVGRAAPQTLGLGAKVTAVRDVTLLLAAEFGLGRAVGRGVPATPPFNLFLGASFNVDARARGATRLVETVRERPVEAPSPRPARVGGVVLDARTRQPLAGALVTVVDARLPPVASDAQAGRFLSYELPGGPVKLAFHKEGFVPVERELVLSPGDTATLEVALEAEVRPALVSLAVTSRKRPVAATVRLRGPQEHQVSLPAPGAPSPLRLPAGLYRVDVTAPGHLAQTRQVQLAEGAQLELALELEPEPRERLVTLKDDRLELAQQVRFAPAGAALLPESHPLLAQVLDVIVRNDLKRVRVEGHTDNQGDKQVNLQLSRDRARAVADHLIRAGLDASRLEAEGYGDTQPVAPNLTPRGRELNRRLEFVILEPGALMPGAPHAE